jgi:hypothetical protein
MSLLWLKKMFRVSEESEESEEKEWLAHLFKNLENVQEKGILIHSRIISVKQKGFLVKTGGMFAYLPFHLMPWRYNQLEYWHTISQTLEGKIFYSKISRIGKNENKTYSIFIDASVHLFRDVELEEHERCNGVVLQVYDHGLLIDIGSHFNWRYGSMVGFVSRLKFMDRDSFSSYAEGSFIDVVYEEKGEKGLIFSEVEYFDFYSKYVGKTLWAKVYKSEEDSSFRLLVEDKYKSTPYRKKVSEKWKDGDTVECEIINFDSQRGLMIKWINDDLDKKSKKRDRYLKRSQYVGKVVDVNLWKNGDDFVFRVENQYPAYLPKKYYNQYRMEDNTVIRCKVQSNSRNHLGLVPANYGSRSEYSILDRIDEAIAEKLIQGIY